MTSLGEVYGGNGSHTSLRRLYLGVGLFLAGAVLLLVAITVTSTEFLLARGFTLGEAREIGGIVGGVAVPTMVLGVFAVLPASRRTRAAAVIGAAVALLGVAMFRHAYPCGWVGATCGPAPDLTLPTVGVYFLGSMTTFWCLFVGVANFKTRNDPGGTARLSVVKRGTTRIVEVDRPQAFGGVGLFGSTPDGDVATQTASTDGGGADTEDAAVVGLAADESRRAGATGNRDGGASSRPQSSGARSTGSSSDDRQQPGAGSTPASDGVDTRDAGSPAGSGAEVLSNGADRPTGDAYCGSCRSFQYVRTDTGMLPYCARHDELMEDMDACEEWEPRV
jgi:hypothetical protein